VCADYPRVAEQAKSAGWEFMGRAYDQMPIHKQDDQAAMIERSLTVIESFTGTRPRRLALAPASRKPWKPPNCSLPLVSNTSVTGYDDEPTVIGSAKGPLVTVPYTVELNDIPMMIGRHHESDYLLKRAIDQFDWLYAEGKHRAKIMALAIHPYISGQPHRIKYLEAILRLWRPLRGRATLQWRADPRLVSLDVRACRHRRRVKVGC
jgi:allantoinase